MGRADLPLPPPTDIPLPLSPQPSYLTKLQGIMHVTVTLPGSGLRCYECTSEKSWADCEIQRKIKTCTKGLFCAKGYAKTDSGDRFIKTCETHSECTNKPSCKLPGVDSSTCQVHCCNTDKCNGGVGITFSTSVLLIVLLLLLLIW